MRIRVVEILKFLVAVAFGYTIRVMIESSYKLESKLIDLPVKNSPDLNLDNIHDQLFQPYKPTSIHDLIEYRYFNLSIVFDTHLGQVETKMKNYHQSDIRDIIRQVRTHINHGQRDKYKVNAFLNGFERIDPIRGKEYVMDLELVPEAGAIERGETIKSRIHRLSLVKPFGYVQLVSQVDVTVNTRSWVNLVYLVDPDRQKSQLELLLHQHETNIIAFSESPPINVSIWLSPGSRSSNVAIIQNKVREFQQEKKQYSNRYQIHLMTLPDRGSDSASFSRSAQRNEALHSLYHISTLHIVSHKLVLLQPHVSVGHRFLQRCHSVLADNVNSVYVPIPFALFRNHSQLHEDSGIWDHSNYDVICINYLLFERAGYFNDKLPIDQSSKAIVNKLIGMKKDVFRSTDPAVMLSYHALTCTDQHKLQLSDRHDCELRQRRTFQSTQQNINSIKLSP